MIYTIRVINRGEIDSNAKYLLNEISPYLNKEKINVRSVKIYRVEGISREEAVRLTEAAFCEKINQDYTIDSKINKGSETSIEIAYKPGVMNPEVESIKKISKDLNINLTSADSSYEYLFSGDIDIEKIEKILSSVNFYNPLIEHIVKKSPTSLLIKGKIKKTEIIKILNLTDDELMKLSKDKLFLNLDEMKEIQKYFKKINRNPTDCELEIIAQSWSEHCVHKTFKSKLLIDGKKKESLFSRIKKTAVNKKNIVSAFVDNSGVIDFYDGYGICGKVETHNSPSAIEPYGGAMTGSGGVFRDVLGTGKGAKILISTDIFCLAPPEMKSEYIPKGCLPPEYILKKVISGVRDYGNRVGIPTNNGSLHFHEDFRAKPTVAVGAYGIIKKTNSKKTSPEPEDIAITLGGKTGRDGIHGATFSSGEMTHKTKTVSGTAVQIGNAIEEKRVIDLIGELTKKNLIKSITDCGAGGYSSALGEMGKDCGVKVFLEKVPLKYPGLSPWEIFLSESQERMVIAVEKEHVKKVLDLARLFNVEASEIAIFKSDKKLKVYYEKEKICELPMMFIHDGFPKATLIGESKISLRNYQNPDLPKNKNDWSTQWEKILSNKNICSKEAIVRQYDHNVQGKTILYPFIGKDMDSPTDGSVVKPFFDKNYGLITAHGLNPVLNKIDSYWGSIWAISEAISNYVSIGGILKESSLIDNFIWPFPDKESLADLDKSVDACVYMSKILGVPFVSGKDSLSSTYRYDNGNLLKIPPVLLISVFGKIPDIRSTVSSDFKSRDSKILIVGNMDINNMGGSIYFENNKLSDSGDVPKTDLKNLKNVLNSITSAINKKMIISCHDISEGGLSVALSEMCFGNNIGASIDLANISNDRPDFIFFNETPGVFLIEIKSDKNIHKIFKNIPYKIIGYTNSSDYIEIKMHKKVITKNKISNLKTVWKNPLNKYFE